MEDLETHLGTYMMDFLQIQVSYAPDFQPETGNSSLGGGISNISYRVHVTATACIKRHNSASVWSPRPAPTPSPIFDIVASH
jgi:hypothetical protein